MEVLVTTIHVSVALFMILVVLIQGGNQGGIGAAFGGGNSQGVFGASGATSFLGKLTYGAAMIFMVTSISLAIIQGKGGDVGLSGKIKESQSISLPAADKDQAADTSSSEDLEKLPNENSDPAEGEKAE